MNLSLSDFLAILVIAASVGGGAMLVGLKLALRSLDRVRTNDLRHLDEKVDHVLETLTRIDRRLDVHLEDHAREVLHPPRRIRR